MKEIYVLKAKAGQILAEPVITSLGGTLYLAGHELTYKDIEVLKAFLIKKIHVSVSGQPFPPLEGESEGAEDQSVANQEVNKQPEIFTEYEQVVKETEKLFKDLQGWGQIPLLEIREYLIPFVKKSLNTPSFVLQILSLSTNPQSYFAHHAVAVSVLTSFLATKAGVDQKELPQIALAGYLHNIGQLKIDPVILNKNIPLTQEEFKEVQQHPKYGYEILKKIPGISEGVKLGALQHHEREDGSGYPLGMIAGQIHSYAKMIAICDTYYAMCSERIYKKALSPFLVLDQLKSDSYGKLDPKYVYFFVELVTSQLYVGTKVMLNNGALGEVIFIDRNTPTRPIVSANGEIINLAQDKNIYIEQIELAL
ncbi:HD-GYP domain-containing protein [Caldalkalibacillus mannanilyticus]|uniref:HD-GYP domain-containing protein n=1 Tax=Caldalkalibacillus mannanilyticus TaxID=1418 RepID=UPI000468C989|nr:HD-GYP domain-containing protein [Caldalkalibacillus mannanilyticus]